MSVIATGDPSRESRCAIARPIPEPAPVITAVRPLTIVFGPAMPSSLSRLIHRYAGVPSSGTMSLEHLDVLIVGAGLSGIGAAYHLQERCPGKSYAMLEARGRPRRHLGPVPLPRHPLGLRHAHARLLASGPGPRPRRSPTAPRSCATSATPAREYGIDEHIRFHHRVVRADWSTERGALDRRGRAHRHRRDASSSPAASCSCAAATTATTRATPRTSPGTDRFAGPIVHPQHWPEDLDYAGKRVVVIGSGATAVTLVPSLAEQAEHVTMLQRSPTYIVSLPGEDPIANGLRRRAAATRPPTRSCAGRTSCCSSPATSSAGAGRSS